ncbi:MAG: 1,6-anhydro-N-acetylmuramyl-L-alanine amidase AmpD [Pseudomonadota bacterium]|jgi:AmpD protein
MAEQPDGVMAWEAGWWSAARRADSPNFGPRPAGVTLSLLVIHNISLPPGEFGGAAVEAFFCNRLDPAAHPYFAEIAGLEVSAHFYIRRDGEVVQFVATTERAWHAGRSQWQGRENCNDYSLGVELEGTDDQPYSAAQYAALERLVVALQQVHPLQALAGHCHVAPGRKTDPGPAFDWRRLARRFPELELPPEVTA